MATKKQPVAAKLAEAFASVQPANPALSSSDKAYLRGLKRRGFTEQEIASVAQKAGFKVPADLFIIKTRKPVSAPLSQAR